MNINWDLVVKISIPLLTLILGKYLDEWLAKKPKLISYLGHVSAFTLRDEKKTQIYTHSVVVRNVGRATTNNVRVGHNFLPDNYQINPSIPHKVEPIVTGGSEILIEKLVPGEQITVSYLYFPPLTWSQINSYTKSDEGFAKILNVIPTPQPSKWVIIMLWGLIFIGVVSLIYFIVGIIVKIVR
jgi:hypothetical protein